MTSMDFYIKNLHFKNNYFFFHIKDVKNPDAAEVPIKSKKPFRYRVFLAP